MVRFGHQRRSGQRDRGLGIIDNGFEPLCRPLQVGRIHRHGDGAGIKTAEKCRDILQTRWVKQQHPLVGRMHVLQGGANGPSLPVELSKREVGLYGCAVLQKSEGEAVGLVSATLIEQVDQGVGGRGRESGRG